MNYNYYFFDLDGTLIESKEGMTKGIKYALSKYDIHVENLDDLDKFIGPPLLESFQKYYGFSVEKSWEAIYLFRKYYSKQGIYEAEVFDGVYELLELLKTRGKKVVLATSKQTLYAEKCLDYFKLDKYFDYVFGSEFDGTRINKTELLKYAISNIPKVSKEEIVMIGDRDIDIIGARKNGVDGILTGQGYGDESEMINEEPIYRVEDIRALILLFENSSQK